MSTATVQPREGCNLAEYAAAKGLDPSFLRGQGLKDVRRSGIPALSIPYFGPDGVEVAVRLRTALSNSAEGEGRFRWRVGDKPIPYGLWRLGVARERGYLVIVEGESDAHTLWQHDIPALGIPGASTWREEWTGLLEGIRNLYVVIESDAGGQAMERWIAKSAIRDRVRLVTLGAAKDPSGLYLNAPDSFIEAWQRAMDSAVPWLEQERSRREARNKVAASVSAALASETRILDRFAEALARAGVVGETRPAKLLYLCVTSRLLERPVSAVLKGPSSAGKSFLCGRVLEFFPERASYTLSAMSERALAYSVEPLKHRMLVLFEAVALDNGFASYLLRSLLSEGRVRYETVDKTADGMRPRLIEREGPTGLLVTTTAIHLDAELETRMLSIPVTDSPEQTAGVMLSAAQAERPETDYAPWRAIQEWLEGAECRVVIPFATALAEMTRPAAVRLRRDFQTILSLIRAHAMLHQSSRARDGAGRIVASPEDYAAVRELVVDLVAEGVGALVSPATRETVEAVRRMAAESEREVTVQDVARQLQLDKSAASRRVRKAVDEGYVKNLEDRRGRPARLVLGDELPEELEILPRPEALDGGSGCAVAADSKGISGPSQDGNTVAEANPLPAANGSKVEAGILERLADAWEPVPEARSPANGIETPREAFDTPSLAQDDLFGGPKS